MPDEHVTAFVRESEEQITVLNNALLDLEQDPEDEEAMEQIFRTAHSLKGNCSAMGFEQASTLAHAIEDLLEEIRTGRVDPAPEIMDAIFAGVDGLEEMLTEIEHHGEPQQAPDELVVSLREHVTDADGLRPPTDGDIQQLLENSRRPESEEYNVYHCRLAIEGTEAVNGPAVFDALDDAFQLLGTNPSKAALDDGDFDGSFDALFASVVEKEAVENALAPVDAVGEAIITDVTDRYSPAPEDEQGAQAATEESISDPTQEPVEDPDDVEVDELLDEVDEFDDLDELAEQVEDTAGLENMGEAGSFADLDIGMDDLEEEAEPAATASGEAADSEPAAETGAEAAPAAADEEPDDAEATFQELKDEVDQVGLDELQDELDDVEFGEYDDEEEVGFDELLDDGDLEDSEEEEEELFETEEPDEAEAGADQLFSEDDIETPAEQGAAADEQATAAESTEQPATESPQSTEDPATSGADSEPAADTGETADAAADATPTAAADAADVDTTAPATEEPAAAEEPTVEEPAAADEPAPEEPAAADEPATPDETAAFDVAEDTVDADSAAVADSADAADVDGFGDEDIDVPDDDDLGVGFDEEVDEEEPGVEVGEAVEDDSFGDVEATADGTDATSFGSGSVDESFADADDSVLDAGTPVDEATATGTDEAATPETGTPADDGSFSTPETDDASFGAPEDPGFGDAPEQEDEEPEEIELTRLGVPPAAGEDEAGDADEIQSIRVDVDQLDDMLNLVEGLVTSRARLRRALDEGEPRSVLDEEIDDLEDVTSELQDTVMDVRLVPVKTAVTKLPRTVRDIAREQDKEVDFEMVGTDVEIDRSILNAIKDPLVHLVRNAVDHGIESPEEREAADKPSEGSVTLSVRRERERVVIEVEDDGRGLDPDQLRSEAVEEGILDLETATTMDDQEAYELVFQAGLSTTEEVSDVSGRGVGMDVVSETVDELDGEVDVQSEPGEGTTIRMELPVTLAIAEVLFVTTGGEEFGIPIRHVEQIGPELGVETEDGKEVLVSDGGEDPEERKELLRLDELLNTPQPAANNGMLVHIQEDVRPVALRCDDVRGQQEVVVKPFEGVLDAVPGLSGATVLGDGDVVNILDIETL